MWCLGFAPKESSRAWKVIEAYVKQDCALRTVEVR